jgi:hypothetical protein
MTPQDIVTARRHMTDGKLKARVVAKMYGVSERSLWRNRGGPRTSRWYGRAKARRLARARVHVVARGLMFAHATNLSRSMAADTSIVH